MKRADCHKTLLAICDILIHNGSPQSNKCGSKQDAACSLSRKKMEKVIESVLKVDNVGKSELKVFLLLKIMKLFEKLHLYIEM
jgi:hypothetical protein